MGKKQWVYEHSCVHHFTMSQLHSTNEVPPAPCVPIALLDAETKQTVPLLKELSVVGDKPEM